MVIVIADNVDFNPMSIISDKEENFITMKVPIFKEIQEILNASNNTALK